MFRCPARDCKAAYAKQVSFRLHTKKCKFLSRATQQTAQKRKEGMAEREEEAKRRKIQNELRAAVGDML